MRRGTSVMFLVILMAVPAGAEAQSSDVQPRVEVGGTAGFIIDPNGGLPTYGPRVTVNFTNRLGVESGVEFTPVWYGSSLTNGRYTALVKYVVRPGSATRGRVFVLAGFAGRFNHEHFYALQDTSIDGSVVSLPDRAY